MEDGVCARLGDRERDVGDPLLGDTRSLEQAAQCMADQRNVVGLGRQFEFEPG